MSEVIPLNDTSFTIKLIHNSPHWLYHYPFLIQRNKDYLSNTFLAEYQRNMRLNSYKESDYYLKSLTAWDSNSLHSFFIVDTALSILIGRIQYYQNNKGELTFDISYILDNQYRNNGITTNAITSSIRYLNTVFSSPIVYTIESENDASYYVAQKCGFQAISQSQFYVFVHNRSIAINTWKHILLP